VELRYLIPAIVLAAFLTDVGLRALPRDRVMFRAWEAVILYPTAAGNFQPDYRYENIRAYGDLSHFGNLPQFREYRRELFTTNRFGFRNAGIAEPGGAPAAIVVGDSFAAGAGVSDDDTLSAQLSRAADRYVYNGAGQGARWSTTEVLIHRLGMKNGLIVWQISERFPIPPSVRAGEKDTDRLMQKIAGLDTPLYRRVRALKRFTASWFLYSPLTVFAGRGLRSLQNGVWLPNPSEHNVVAGQLKNGDRMLFLRSEVDNFYRPPQAGGLDYFAEVNALVRSTGNRLLVVLVPDKYNVYYPLLEDPAHADPASEPNPYNLEQGLLRIGVPVVNLTPLLRSDAARELPLRQYNYWIDDTHWNPHGIHTAAAEVLRQWQSLR
jgi:hypothetical protein